MNKKGFTVVELIVSFALTMLVVTFLFEMIISLKDIYVESGIKSQLLNKQAIISSKVNNDFKNKTIKIALKCGSGCLNFFFDDNSSTKLIVDTNSNLFTYGNYTTKLIDGSSFGAFDIRNETVLGVNSGDNDSFIIIKIPINHPLLKTDDFGINITYQYDSRVTSISDISFDSSSATEDRILLKGASTMSNPSGTTWVDPGYYVAKADGAIEDTDIHVTVTGTVGTTVGTTYILTYTLRDLSSNIVDVKTRNVTVIQSSYLFAYNGLSQTFTAPVDGVYKVELWGAQGGGSGGKGAYTSGNVKLSQNNILNVFVGGAGTGGGVPYTTVNSNGWNGGGNGGFFTNAGYQARNAGGGGGTDVRAMPKNSYRYVRDYMNGNTVNSSNHWVEIQVYSGGTNVASLKPVIGSVAESDGLKPYTWVTNGDVTTANYTMSSQPGLQYVEIDLGAEYPIDYVKIYHFYGDVRSYTATKTVLYNTDRKVSYNIYNSNKTGTYVEAASGKTVTLLDPTNFDSLKTRIMVAGGGGGNVSGYGAPAGALVGANGAGGLSSSIIGTGGTQTKGGNGTYPGSFGIGGNGYISVPDSPNCNDGTAGGAGYYGGGGGTGGDPICSPNASASGGGGSSFISGYNGSNAVDTNGNPTGQANHYSGYTFSNTKMYSGLQSMPTMTTSFETGHAGDGYAKITLLSVVTTSEASLTSVEVLVVAGGGGGSGSTWGGGGGGAGGVLYKANHTVAIGNSITVTVGIGGAGGNVGGSSFFGSLQAFGGGPANGSQTASDRNGGSGGGGGHMSPSGLASSSIQTSNNGGTGYGYGGGATNYASPYPCGSGGGAGAAGLLGGVGGAGRSFDISGTAAYYAGGGGQADNAGTITNGGTGGGGAGGNTVAGVSGTTNTGGGGGGSRGGTGGFGGSGIVIVRYLGIQKANGGTITSSGGYTIHTFTTSSTFEVW